MTAGLMLSCFMCDVEVSYRKNDFSKLENHLRNEHRIKREYNYLLAGCFMTGDEREAVKDVISDKIEMAVEVPVQKSSSNRSDVRFRCSHCPISFTMKENLREHLERKHKVKASKGVIISKVSRRSAPGELGVKSERAMDEDEDDPLGSTPERQKNKKSFMKTKPKRMSMVRPKSTGDYAIAAPGEVPGDGKVCRLCEKQFPNNPSMKRHFEDIHQPGEFPCKGCGKIFTSMNKVSSHYSRNCKERERRSM